MKRPYRKSYKKGISFLMAAACISALLSGCGQQAADEGEVMDERIPVQVQSPQAGTLTLKNEFVGTISPGQSVYVMPLVTAEVLNADVSVGDNVTAGEVLCELDDEAAELQLASAKAQYDSAAAGVNSAQIGYEAAQAQYAAAQAQYESTVAQLDAQLGGQKNLQLYQLQSQVDNINSGIDNINSQIDDLEDDKKDAEKAKDSLRESRNDARAYLEQAAQAYAKAEAEVTALEPQEYTQYEELIDAYNALYPGEGEKVYEYDLESAKKSLDAARSTYEQASAAVSQLESAYEQAKAGIQSIEDGQDQLNDTLSDTYRSLQQAETVRNITAEQIYSDTQKVVDANKNAAAVGLDTAAIGIDSAAATVNSAKVGVEGAQVAIESAQYQKDMYTLKAPIDGIIEAVNVNEHDLASPGSPAYVISNKDTMTVTFYTSEGIRNTLSVGQKVEVDRNGKKFSAAITEIGSMIDQNTGLFAIKASVSAPDESLLTGCSVKVLADTYSQQNAILIPYDAVYYDGGQPYVYVEVDGMAQRKDIETGIFDEQTMTVLSGLTVEDKLIVSWSANLREGALVSVQGEEDTGETQDTSDVSEGQETGEVQDAPEASQGQETGKVSEVSEGQDTGKTSETLESQETGKEQKGSQIRESETVQELLGSLNTGKAQDTLGLPGIRNTENQDVEKTQAGQDNGTDSALTGEE